MAVMARGDTPSGRNDEEVLLRPFTVHELLKKSQTAANLAEIPTASRRFAPRFLLETRIRLEPRFDICQMAVLLLIARELFKQVAAVFLAIALDQIVQGSVARIRSRRQLVNGLPRSSHPVERK